VTGEPRPVLVAPDKFKGTLSASEAALAIGRGLAAGGIERLELLPLADGGEGTMEAMVHARRGRILAAHATDALGRRVDAAFALLEGGRVAVVEQAQASGLWRLAQDDRDAEGATSRGTGELIAAAIDSGAREVLVTVGGSATSDGGRGALEALGGHFTTRTANLAELRKRLRGVRLSVACDVRNPLVGTEGAARVFAPQKGASPEQVEEIEKRLRAWAGLARRETGRNPAAEPMAGAGGGLAGGLWAFAGATLRPGAALVLDAVGFDALAHDALAVVTGEGRLDEQTVGGKLLFEVATRARQGGVPCYAVVGKDDLDAFEHRLMNIEVEAASRNGTLASAQMIEHAARRVARRLTGGN
jgi:glycerate 2-kinase